MLKKIIWIIPLLALLGGAVAGDMLSTKPEPEEAEAAEGAEGEGEGEGEGEATAEGEHPAPEESGEATASEEDHAKEPAAAGRAEPADEGAEHGEAKEGEAEEGESASAWFSFPSQFFVPLVQRGEIDGMMVLTLTIETSSVDLASVAEMEHRLRDALLRVLIIHANTGGFMGNYTDAPKLDRLREALLKAAVAAAGPMVRAVLVEDIGLAGS